MSIGVIMQALFLTVCIWVLIICLVNIVFIPCVELPRNHNVFIFRMKMVDELSIEEYDSMPSYEIMLDYNWIPLEKEYWVGKDYEKLRKIDVIYLSIRYRIFQKWRP